MRGDDNQQEGMFSYVSPEKRVPADHPLRPIRKMVDEILKEMSPQFAKLYSEVGRPSIAPERLFRSLLLQIFYSVRSERMLIEQLQYNLLFRWFVGMEMDEAVWNHAVYSKNRERLLNEEVAESFFQRVLERIDNRSGCPAIHQVPRERGEAQLHGTCNDGKPQRAIGADPSDRGDGPSGAGRHC